MKFREAGTIIFIIFVSLCAISGVVSKYWLGDDNVIEQAAEALIEQELGIEIDLSADTEEEW